LVFAYKTLIRVKSSSVWLSLLFTEVLCFLLKPVGRHIK